MRTSLLMSGVSKRFGERTLFEGVDLEVAHGEFVALLGQSGCGKTTLLRLVAGLDTDVDGRIDVTPSRAMVFQDAALVPWKRAVDNVRLGLRGGTTVPRALTALAEVGLSDRSTAWPKTLSGGEAQRVALARALVREPELLLLDEPFGALDALTRMQMHALLGEVCRLHRPAVLLVTHDVEEALLLADRVVVLRDGRLVHHERVQLPAPRHRSDPVLQAARMRVLRAIGVDDVPGPEHG